MSSLNSAPCSSVSGAVKGSNRESRSCTSARDSGRGGGEVNASFVPDPGAPPEGRRGTPWEGPGPRVEPWGLASLDVIVRRGGGWCRCEKHARGRS